MHKAEEGSVTIDGSRVDYAKFGYGKKPLLLIPGLSIRGVRGTAIPLAHRYRIFCEKYRVFVIDRKEEIPEGYTVRDMAEDLAKTCAALNIKKADVIGVSQGGMIAQYLALDHPELVHKLVLGVTLSRNNETVLGYIDRCVGFAEKNDFEGLVNDLMITMYSDEYIQKYRWLFPLVFKMSKITEPERFIHMAKACLTCETYDRLEEIRCPVLVLGGEKDRIVSAEASREIAEKLGCELYMYENLGHSAYEEGKDFNERILAFLNGEKQIS